MAQRHLVPLALLNPSGGFLLFFYLPANQGLKIDDLEFVSLKLL